MILCQSENNSNQDLGSNRSLFPDSYELVFKKPVYDIAFISITGQLSSKISSLQNYFQSKHKFTTHHIFLNSSEEIHTCLRDLKQDDISYAIVLNENSEISNLYDLYVLHRDEVLTTITIEKVEELIEKDFNNLMNKVKILKSIPSKSPHDESLVRISEQLRHYFCLLLDYRTLTMKELNYVKDYLITQKEQMEKERNRSQQKESQSYSIYEPIQLKDHRNSHEFPIEEKNNCIQPSRFVFKGSNRSSTVVQFPHSEFTQKPSVNYTIFDVGSETKLPKSVSQYRISDSHLDFENSMNNSTNSFFNSDDTFPTDPLFKSSNSDSKLERSNKYLSKRTSDSKNFPPKKISLCKAEIMLNKLASSSGIIAKIDMKNGRVTKLLTEYQKVKLSNNYSKKKDTSLKVKYVNSIYFRNKVKESPSKPSNHKSSASSSVSNRNKETLGTVNNSKENRSDSDKHGSKRKLDIVESSPIKLNKLDVSLNTKSQVANNPLFIPPKSSPDSLINLFVMVLNLIPLELPNNNAIYKIISHSCIEIQEGILEPALKNVKINYDNCKANGVNEIIANIYSIYNESEKEVKNASFMMFIWNKYFPSQLSNFNLMILFYRFVKLLMLYTMFNKSLVTKKLVLDVIDKIDVIVNFDFNSSVSTFKRKQLSCFSNKFEKYFKEHDQLHVLYAKLNNSKSVTVDKKKLDSTIKRKKINFTVGPLLQYFITSLNSIHDKMEPIQIEMIYGAIRTLRFCLRKINLQLLQTSFTKPHLFNFSVKKMDSHLDEILKEIRLLCKEIKYYQCVLFTEKHYDFINCLLDFSWMIEGTIDVNSEAYKSKSKIKPLITLDPKNFINDFSSYETPIFLQYHPESELEYLKGYLKERWTGILNEAFSGSIPEPCGSRIINEINVLLPPSWGLLTFDEAITEASKLYYEGFHKLVETDPKGWYAKFSNSKSSAKNWLTKYHLPINNLEVLNDYQYMLESKYKYAT